MPTSEEVDQAFWKLDAMLAAGGDDADV